MLFIVGTHCLIILRLRNAACNQEHVWCTSHSAAQVAVAQSTVAAILSFTPTAYPTWCNACHPDLGARRGDVSHRHSTAAADSRDKSTQSVAGPSNAGRDPCRTSLLQAPHSTSKAVCAQQTIARNSHQGVPVGAEGDALTDAG